MEVSTVTKKLVIWDIAFSVGSIVAALLTDNSPFQKGAGEPALLLAGAGLSLFSLLLCVIAWTAILCGSPSGRSIYIWSFALACVGTLPFFNLQVTSPELVLMELSALVSGLLIYHLTVSARESASDGTAAGTA